MKILLIGSNGRMGKQMQKYLKEKDISYFAVDKHNFYESNSQKFDIIVDFSCAEALKQNLDLAIQMKKPILVATTNHSAQNEHMLKLASELVAVAVCPNLSLGILCFNKMLKDLLPIKDYDFVLAETHHKTKKDSPSGTAKQIIKNLENLNIKTDVNCVRAGTIIGEHSLIAYGENEVLEIKHTALSRNCFCEGAVKVCQKLIACNKGFYKIEDLL